MHKLLPRSKGNVSDDLQKKKEYNLFFLPVCPHSGRREVLRLRQRGRSLGIPTPPAELLGVFDGSSSADPLARWLRQRSRGLSHISDVQNVEFPRSFDLAVDDPLSASGVHC